MKPLNNQLSVKLKSNVQIALNELHEVHQFESQAQLLEYLLAQATTPTVNGVEQSVYDSLLLENESLKSENQAYQTENQSLKAENQAYQTAQNEGLQGVHQENQALLQRLETAIELDTKQYGAICTVNQNREKRGIKETVAETFWGFFVAYHHNPVGRFYTGY